MTPPSAPRVDVFTRAGIAVVTVLLGVMLARVAQLQLRPPGPLAAATGGRQTRMAVPAVRGSILDRRGRLLAVTEIASRVFADPAEFPTEPDEAIARLADAIGVPADTLGEKLVPKLAENDRRRATIEAGRSTTPDPAGWSLVGLFTTDAATRSYPDDDARGVSPPDDAPEPRLIRYVRLTDAIPESAAAAVRSLRIPGVHVESVPVRRYPADGIAASIVGKVGFDHAGLLGAEYAREPLLRGRAGRIAYTRDARGRPLWMHPESYERADPGANVRLSIDLELQRIAVDELTRGVHEADAAGGRLVLLDAGTGEVLAMADVLRPIPGLAEFPFADAQGRWTPSPPGTRYRVLRPDPARDTHPALGRNRCIEDAYEPGSTFKPFVWSAVLEKGRARPDEVLDTAGGQWHTKFGRPIVDVVRRATMTWAEVLLNSSNIGMVKGADRLTHTELRDAITAFGFGRATGLGLPGESPGLLTSPGAWTHLTQESVAFGAEVAVTPVQMVRAFSVFARTGERAGTLPAISLLAAEPDDPARTFAHRLIRPGTGALVREILSENARRMEAVMLQKDRAASGWRYPLFGKSGTAKIALGKPPPGRRLPPGHKGYFERQYVSSFLAAGPVADPKLVIIVLIDDPGPETVRRNEYYGSHVAGPVVRRTMERALAYLGVPPSAPADPLASRRAAATGE